MMNRATCSQMWDMMRQRHGIGMRAIERLPEDKLDSRPVANMRTPKELVVHWYGMSLKGIAEGALRGRLEDLDEKAVVARIKTKTELLAYCRECWDAADRAVGQMTDEKLNATVGTPWGISFPGYACLGITNDETLHHRGQFYAYLRVLGQEPPNMWDFEHNAPEYQPKAHAAQA
jgi:uncharacterized damage-inducible protein DinB